MHSFDSVYKRTYVWRTCRVVCKHIRVISVMSGGRSGCEWETSDICLAPYSRCLSGTAVLCQCLTARGLKAAAATAAVSRFYACITKTSYEWLVYICDVLSLCREPFLYKLHHICRHLLITADDHLLRFCISRSVDHQSTNQLIRKSLNSIISSVHLNLFLGSRIRCVANPHIAVNFLQIETHFHEIAC